MLCNNGSGRQQHGCVGCCQRACRFRGPASPSVLLALLLASCLACGGPIQPAYASEAAAANGDDSLYAQLAPYSLLLQDSVLGGGLKAGPDWSLEHAALHIHEHVQHSHAAAVEAATIPVPNRFSKQDASGSGRRPCTQDRDLDIVLSQ
jgi:hypothetical protein